MHLARQSWKCVGLFNKKTGVFMSDLPILFTATQVAKIMGISRSQVYVLLNRGQLGSVHIGRSRRITRAQVDEFISDLTAAA
jgi:excisionase family DNA binding protein